MQSTWPQARWTDTLFLFSRKRLPLLVVGLALIGAVLVAGAFLSPSKTQPATAPRQPEQTQSGPIPDSSANDGYFLPEYDSSPAWDSGPAKANDTGWGLAIDVFVKLGLVLAIIYGTAWGIKRFRLWTRPSLAAGQSIQIIETAYMAPQRTLHLVQVQGHSFLIGATEQNLSLIAELSHSGTETSEPEPARTPVIVQHAPDGITDKPDTPFVPPPPATTKDKDRSFDQLLTEMESRVGQIRAQIAQHQQARERKRAMSIPQPGRSPSYNSKAAQKESSHGQI